MRTTRMRRLSRQMPRSVRWGLPELFGMALACLLATAPPLHAQGTLGSRSVPMPTLIEDPVAPVPFGPGEQAEYQVKLGPLSVGSGLMQVVGVEPVRGYPTYHVSWMIQGGIPFARVDDHYESWIDVETLATRRSIQRIKEVRYRANRQYEIYPEEGRWEQLGTEDADTLSTEFPLDDISFIYYVRTLPLEVGETYTLNRYFRADRNPVLVKVLRKETIEVPAGKFDTVVVQPIIKSRGLFGEGGEAEVYLSDDDRRILVRLTSKVPVMGSLSLHLRAYQEGAPVRH
jgi:Protein of unknown function (DUF3108)